MPLVSFETRPSLVMTIVLCWGVALCDSREPHTSLRGCAGLYRENFPANSLAPWSQKLGVPAPSLQPGFRRHETEERHQSASTKQLLVREQRFGSATINPVLPNSFPIQNEFTQEWRVVGYGDEELVIDEAFACA